MHWVKPGADEATARQDLSACGRQAWLRTQAEGFYFRNSVPYPVALKDAQGRPFIAWGERYYPDPALIEQSYLRLCMRDKGYELVPIERAGKSP